jgi:membrane-bound lytic murein transglycosylase
VKVREKEMQITRLYTGDDGESHFEDMDIPMKDLGANGQRSETYKAEGIVFRENSAQSEVKWHNAPARQFVITIQGEVEITVGDGTKRRFGPGAIMLAEDLTGRVHYPRVVSEQPRMSIFVTLD